MTSPLFDVVSEEYRRFLYGNPYNSIHLSVPAETNPGAASRERFRAWVADDVLQREAQPALYPYEQEFSLPGSHEVYRRKGFIAFIKAYNWEEEVIFRHENTIPRAVNDRTEMLRQSQVNVSPTHGLYHDPDFRLEPHIEAALREPRYEVEDYQGVINRMGCITDPALIQQFVTTLRDKEIILADGHHRYAASQTYRNEQRRQNPKDTGEEVYHFHQMYLTNSASDDLRILPTHRLIVNWPPVDVNLLLERLREFFRVQPLPTPYDIEEIIAGKRWAFGMLLPSGAYQLRLKPEVHPQLDWKFPQVVKDLDLTVMHYFIIEKVLGIPGRKQRSSRRIAFERNFSACLDSIRSQKASIALITNEIQMEEVQAVCKSGYTMPQKATYFYPKALCGLVFGSVDEW